MCGLHSPFGTIGNIKRERGYTHEHILWGESWINILMECADAPHYSKKEKTPIIESADQLAEVFGKRKI